MEKLEFRTLTADEIECRVAQMGKTQSGAWCSLLLYKDARCDQRLLDETVGCFRWKREHELINGNLFCTVSIKDDAGEWITKQDVGTESNTEKEKGQASDAFKRACFNWGLGRELYTSPKIFVNLNENEFTEQQGKIKVNTSVSFRVSAISYDEKRNIKTLVIIDSRGDVRFTYGLSHTSAKKQSPAKEVSSNQSASVNGTSQVALEKALSEIALATTTEQLKSIFNRYSYYQRETAFMSSLTAKKTQILNNGKTAA